MSNDPSLLTLEELVAEVGRRCEGFVLAVERMNKTGDVTRQVKYFWGGTGTGCVGLAALLGERIIRDTLGGQ